MLSVSSPGVTVTVHMEVSVVLGMSAGRCVPISIVKNSKEFLDCDRDKNFCHSWISEIDGKTQEEAKTLLGLLDTSYLVSYAIFMFVSGFIAERVDLRIFLTGGMLTSGLLTVLFGAAYFTGTHTVWYLLVIQIIR